MELAASSSLGDGSSEMRTHVGRRRQPDNDRFIDNRELEEMEERRVREEGGANVEEENKVGFADLRRQKARDQFRTSGIHITYQEKEDAPKRSPKNSANLISWASQQHQQQPPQQQLQRNWEPHQEQRQKESSAVPGELNLT